MPQQTHVLLMLPRNQDLYFVQLEDSLSSHPGFPRDYGSIESRQTSSPAFICQDLFWKFACLGDLYLPWTFTTPYNLACSIICSPVASIAFYLPPSLPHIHRCVLSCSTCVWESFSSYAIAPSYAYIGGSIASLRV